VAALDGGCPSGFVIGALAALNGPCRCGGLVLRGAGDEEGLASLVGVERAVYASVGVDLVFQVGFVEFGVQDLFEPAGPEVVDLWLGELGREYLMVIQLFVPVLEFVAGLIEGFERPFE
jgi:hypothetical protein